MESQAPIQIRRDDGLALDRAAPGPRQRWFRLVTGAKDGHGTRFLVSGGDLSRHRRNPLLIWGHATGRNSLGDPPDPRCVIGRVADYDHTADHLDILAEFDTEPFADLVWQKVQKGLIRACSLGALAAEPPVEEDDGTGKMVPTFRRWTLVEASVVTVGSNPEAMALSRELGDAYLALGVAPALPATTPDLLAPGAIAAAAPAPVPDPPAIIAPAPAPISARAAELPDAAAIPAPAPGGPLAPLSLPVDAPAEAPRRRAPRGEVSSVAVHRGGHDGPILMLRRRDNGLWTTPGGHVGAGENPADAARRELREEAGLDADVAPLGTGRVGRYTVHAFRAVVPADAEPSTAGDPDREAEEHRWVGREEYRALKLHAPRNVLLHLIGWHPADGIEDLRPVGGPSLPATDQIAPPPARDEGAPSPTAPVETRGAVDHAEFPTVDGPWDADGAKRRFARWASSDGSGDPAKIDWSKYRQCFAWFDDEHPGLNAGKLPHHDIRGGRPVTVWRGVVAAAAALAGARGGVGIPAADEAKVKAHLGQHYREFGRRAPWEADERAWDSLRASVRRPGFAPEWADKTIELLSAGEADSSDERARRFQGAIHAWADAVEAAYTGRAAPSDRYSGIGFKLAPGVASALRDGLRWHREGYGGPGLVEATIRDARRLEQEGSWWPEKARAAAAWFARHGAQGHPKDEPADPASPRTGSRRPTPAGVAWALWGGDAGRAQVAEIARRMREADEAAERAALGAVTGLRGSALLALQRELADPYLPHTGAAAERIERSVAALGQIGGAVLEQARPPQEKKKMAKLDPSHIAAMRGLISHKCDAAEMHARAHEALPPAGHEGLRAMHSDMAQRCLRDAEEMMGAAREMHAGNLAPEGEARAVPSFLKDGEMQRAFSGAYAALGPLPRTLRAVVRDEMGDEDPERVAARLAAMKDDSEELAGVQEKAQREAAQGAVARAESLIEEGLRSAAITPARALEMRGHDPATYASGAAPTRARWSAERVAEYLGARRGRPVAEVRTDPLRGADGSPVAAQPAPLAPAAAPQALPGYRASLVRAGQSPLRANEVDMRVEADRMATLMARGDLPGQTRDAASAEDILGLAAAMQRGEIAFGAPSGDLSPLNAGGGMARQQ